MKYKGVIKVNNKFIPLEVYKIQTSIFGSTVLIYNEDKSNIWEEHEPNNVKVIKDFIGRNIEKCYATGYLNKKGQIVLVDLIQDKKYYF